MVWSPTGTRQYSATAWNTVGMMFLFAGAWFACGIAGPPGNALSQDIALRDLDIAYFSSGKGDDMVYMFDTEELNNRLSEMKKAKKDRKRKPRKK